MSTLPKLALIPSGYKASKVYSALPTNGDGDFTFSRTSNATRVNENGFIETVDSNVPRLDYSDSNCPSLLLEPSATNYIIESEDFSIWGWTGSVSRTPNSTISPDGKNNAYLLEDTGNGDDFYYITYTNDFSGMTMTVSCFFKFGTSDYATIFLVANGIADRIIVKSDNTLFYASPNIDSSNIEVYKNGWTRVSATFTVGTSNTYIQTRIYPSYTDGTSTGRVNSSTGNLYVWGAQLEQGSYSTSYIPTEGSTVTRTVDSCLNGGDANLFNDSEGTLFVDLENFDATSSRITLSNGFASNRISFLFYGSSSGAPNRIRFYLERESQIQVDSLYNITYTFNQRNKIAFRYKQNDFKAYINGIEVFSDTIGNTPIGLSRLDFSQENQSSNFIEGKINDTRYYNTALTDAELQALTTL